MTKLGRPSIWDQHGEAMQQRYEAGASRGDIAREFNTSVQTVTRVLGRRGVQFEDRVGKAPQRSPEEQAAINAKVSASRKGKGTGPRKGREQRTCEQCGTSYTYVPGRTGAKYCSTECRNIARSSANRQSALEAYEANPRRCPCGEAIPYEHRHTRLYCTPEHRAEYQAKRQPDPDNYVTFNCLNCGTEVTRYKNYGNGHNKYCSNACAQRHTKTTKHYAIEDLEAVFKGSWECMFFGLCCFLKVPIEPVNREHGVAWGDSGWYAPDFVVVIDGLSIAVEIKGVEDAEDAECWRVYREQRGALVVLDRTDLDRLRQSPTVRRDLYESATLEH